MEVIQISKTSWHYRFMSWCDEGHVAVSDICEYSRKLVLRLIAVSIGVLILLFLAGLIMFTIGDTMAWIAACITTLSFLNPEPTAGGFLVVAFIFGVSLTIYSLFKRYRSVVTEKMDIPFISKAYDSWKNKFCVRVEFHE